MFSRHEITTLVLAFAERYRKADGNVTTQADLINALTDQWSADETASYQHAYELGRADGAAGYSTNEPDTASLLIDRRMDRAAESKTLLSEVRSMHSTSFEPPENFYPTLTPSQRRNEWALTDPREPNGFHGSTDPNYAPRPGYVNPA